jgi:4'-phosphopantetheinyl transferase
VADVEGRVVVRILPREDGPDVANEALVELVAVFLSAPGDQVRLGRRCPQCAATDHGRPVVVAPVDGSRVHLSVGRTLGRVAVAIGSSGPLGVDIERVDAARFAGVAAVVQHRDEPEADTLPGLASRWVRKEAVLKATGWGLTEDPTNLDLTSDGRSPFAVMATRNGQAVRMWVTDLDLGTQYAAAVAVIGESPPRVTLVS